MLNRINNLKMKLENKSVQDEWIICLPESDIEDDNTIVYLTHPGNNNKSLFLYNSTKESLSEIKKHKESHSAWFIDESVQSDGSVYTVTSFDPLYCFVSCLQRNYSNSKFVILEQLFSNDKHVGGQYLHKCLNVRQMSLVADSSGTGEYVGYRFNEEKTLKWLKIKINNICKAISELKIYINKSENKKNEEKFDQDTIHYACGIVSQYINPELNLQLHKYLGIPLKPRKRKSDSGVNEPNAKKTKTECNEDYSAITEIPKPKPKLTKKQRELEKVDKKGMKSIASFFSPKPKAKK